MTFYPLGIASIDEARKAIGLDFDARVTQCYFFVDQNDWGLIGNQIPDGVFNYSVFSIDANERVDKSFVSNEYYCNDALLAYVHAEKAGFMAKKFIWDLKIHQEPYFRLIPADGWIIAVMKLLNGCDTHVLRDMFHNGFGHMNWKVKKTNQGYRFVYKGNSQWLEGAIVNTFYKEVAWMY